MQVRLSRRSLALGLAVGLLTSCASPPIPSGSFRGRMKQSVLGQKLAYLLEVPDPDGMPEEGWPLVLFLHGAGERGDDLDLVSVHGPPKVRTQIPELGMCVLLAPQCPAGSWWHPDPLKALVLELLDELPVDSNRIYVTGLSMGGYGTWGLLARYPDLAAAAIPICGGGDVSRLNFGTEPPFSLGGLLEARQVPIRAYHGEADTVIPVAESRILVNALEGVGADVELVVYPGVGHDSWTETYLNRDLYRWMLKQRKQP